MTMNRARSASIDRTRRWTLLALMLGTLLASLSLSHAPVQALSFTVTKTADTADGVCDADCSLREAIVAANASPGLDTIAFNIATGSAPWVTWEKQDPRDQREQSDRLSLLIPAPLKGQFLPAPP